MINSMRGCVACDDLWPWPISSRSFGRDLENRVRSVASTVLDGFFLYLAQMITIIRGCVACSPRNEVKGGYIGFTLSVCLSVCPSVCPLTFRVRPVASTVQDGFFPYLVQMINSMRGCVACDDLWPWPISSRSFGLDLENRVLQFWQGCTKLKLAWGLNCKINFRPDFHAILCCLVRPNMPQLSMRHRTTSSQHWHPLPQSRSHTQRHADVGSRSQAAQSAT